MIQLIKESPTEYRPVVKRVKCNGIVVMRTASRNTFEVMNVSSLGSGECWGIESTIEVRKLYPGEKYLLELS